MSLPRRLITKLSHNSRNLCPILNPREHNQKDATATTQTTLSIRAYLYFIEPGTLETFLRDYRRILTTHFQQIIIEGGGEYWSCVQEHDPRNWNWKPWQHLERLCQKRCLDDFAVRDILEEHLERKLECECQVLFDERQLRKDALRRQFGVDFDSGEVGLVD